MITSELAIILNGISDPIFVKDHERRWVFGNDAFSLLIAKTPAEYLGKTDQDIFSKDIADNFSKIDDGILKAGVTSESEFTILNSLEEERLVRAKKIPVQTKNGHFLVCILHDLTKERTQNRRLLFSALMSSFSEIASGIAHNINNPLTILLGRAQQLKRLSEKEKISSQEIEAIATSIEDACRRSLNVVKELNTLATRTFHPEERPIEIAKLFESLDKLFRDRFDSLDVKFSLHIDSPDLFIKGVDAEIRQMLITLTQFSFNSVYNLPRREIRWTAEKFGSSIRLKLFDSRINNSSQNANRASAFASTAKNPQYTVGFSIAESIVSAHGGHLKYSSEKESWKAEILLPAYNENDCDIEEAS